MITCPWCGTNYRTFQPNCQNCGGPLPGTLEGIPTSDVNEDLPIPPAAPRSISNSYVWRLLLSDGMWITGLILGLIGFIFFMVGGGLTIGIITAFIGIPFLLLGLAFLAAGVLLFVLPYQKAQKVVSVLRDGDSTNGILTGLQENYSVSINGRSPWIIDYEYQINGQTYQGKLSTLNQPGPQMQVGKPVKILYLAAEPNWSSIYPHP
jgi:hypothetical protein